MIGIILLTPSSVAFCKIVSIGLFFTKQIASSILEFLVGSFNLFKNLYENAQKENDLEMIDEYDFMDGVKSIDELKKALKKLKVCRLSNWTYFGCLVGSFTINQSERGYKILWYLEYGTFLNC